MTTEYEFLIKNATIVEGTGKKAYVGNIGVVGEKVGALGEVSGDAKKEINATGLTAVPGFVDSHSHNDGMLLFYPYNESYVMQGVTSFIGGQCGGTTAPLTDLITIPGRLSEYIQEYVPHKYYISQSLFPRDQVNVWMKEKFGWTVDWHTMAEYFKRVEDKGISMNYAPLFGHRMARYYVMGEDNKRVATKKEVADMGEVIRKGLQEGCIGMSVGLDYDPDVFADKSEMIEHAAILNQYPNAVFCPHSRRTGRRRGLGAGVRQHDKIDGLNEILDICRQAKVKMNIAHLYTGWYIKPEDSAPEIVEEANRRATLMLLDRAVEEGMDITFDVIPSLAVGGFENLRYLCSLFVPWLRELGSPEELAKWLKVADFRSEIKEAINTGKIYWREGWNPNLNPQWATNLTILKSKIPGIDGKTIAQIAAERKKDQMDTVFDVIAEDPYARATTGTMKLQSSNLRTMFYKHPRGCVGMDTSARDAQWEGKHPPYGIPSSNTFDAFARFFTQFVRDEPIFSLEEAVLKTSTQAAKVHGLKGRGVIEPGSYADIVLMDLPGLQTPADVMEPRRHPKGIEYVFVNGAPVVEKGTHTKATPGKVLRRQ